MAPVHFCRELAAKLFAAEEFEMHSVAREALKRAARSDEPADLFAYGSALAKGMGGQVNLPEAEIWLARAESHGFPGALSVLDRARRE